MPRSPPGSGALAGEDAAQGLAPQPVQAATEAGSTAPEERPAGDPPSTHPSSTDALTEPQGGGLAAGAAAADVTAEVGAVMAAIPSHTLRIHSVSGTVDPGTLVRSDAVSSAGPTPAVHVADDMVAIALHFSGRCKHAVHLASTVIGDIIPGTLGISKHRLAIIDCHGFEVARDVPLGLLARQVGTRGVNGNLLDLTLSVDDWKVDAVPPASMPI